MICKSNLTYVQISIHFITLANNGTSKLMKQLFVSFIILLNQSVSLASPNTDSLINEVNRAIKNAHIYDSNKLNNVAKLKNQLIQSSPANLDQQYKLYLQLYEEYKYYNYDSALLLS